jgi:hypothetical protein
MGNCGRQFRKASFVGVDDGRWRTAGGSIARPASLGTADGSIARPASLGLTMDDGEQRAATSQGTVVGPLAMDVGTDRIIAGHRRWRGGCLSPRGDLSCTIFHRQPQRPSLAMLPPVVRHRPSSTPTTFPCDVAVRRSPSSIVNPNDLSLRSCRPSFAIVHRQPQRRGLAMLPPQS